MREDIEAIRFYVRKLQESVEIVTHIKNNEEEKAIEQTVRKIKSILKTLTALLFVE